MALVIATLLALSMVSAFAEATDASTTFQVATLTVNGIKAGNVLKLYKIGTPMYDADTNNLTYSFVTGITENDFDGIDSDGYVFMENGSAAKTLADTLAKKIANSEITPSATETATAVAGTPDHATFTNLPAGYYVGVVSGDNDASIIYQNMLINAMPIANAAGTGYEAVTIADFTVKSSPEEITKANGATFDHTADVDTTDEYSVGDYVPYQIITHIPNYPTPSKVATFKITDTPSDLTDSIATSGDHALTVTVDGTPVAASATTWRIGRNGENDTDGFVIEFEKDYILANAGKSVLVEYEAQIKSSAVITTAGLTAENTASIIFNPNPNEDTTVEPEDQTEDYTYGLVVFKYKEEEGKTAAQSTPLANAQFKLVKAVADTSEGAAEGATKPSESADDIVRTGTTNSAGLLSWNGLAAGKYYLIETAAPSGYVLDPTPRLVELNETNANGDDPITTTVTEEYYEQADVPNREGTTLPSTGGMGTTILYIGGSILVILAAILLITKRRMNAED